ncbi:hypothetical protein Rhom172_2898 (plasmid) [Rhodothermus marinus SG0.5JP17-172]|uniref:hypothetical protein n=1 Tax=Rhodothermus marinus TaxID=29549 RepID=UPI000223D272|nr:hypothetical protein [Rhodothermus marinus]AEN74775.1 hypothetical protein Rhom172_2898 [Rhodothermus marinus SG0.5JP17-172]
MENRHAALLKAEQQIQEIAAELSRLRDATLLLTEAQQGVDQVLRGCQHLNDRVADLFEHLHAAANALQEAGFPELKERLDQQKTDLEKLQERQQEALRQFDALRKTLEYLHQSILRLAAGYNSLQLRLQATGEQLQTGFESLMLATSRLTDRIAAIETRQQRSLWTLAAVAGLVLLTLIVVLWP